MNSLRYTLLADGTSDRCLMQVINWTLEQIPDLYNVSISSQFADPFMLNMSPKDGEEHVREAVRRYPCDVLFFHRDAEKEPRENRLEEIGKLTRGLKHEKPIPVVPVRMTEAWLLINERAIRLAADNPNGNVHLSLPLIHTIENLPDPKQTLKNLLIAASEKSGRRLTQFQRGINHRLYRVATYISDFSPLRNLSAYQVFEAETRSIMKTLIHKR
ncbi:MAG TPA: hypothetical protein PLI09_14095 [Candidatus Hydrogenedentes bacterium]|nr:hypothetical protein [Candidatus Hydrogenedentota bacterium]